MTTVDDYLDSLPAERQAAMRHMHDVLSAAVPELDVSVWDYSGELIAYGRYHYRTKSGLEGDWFGLGLANRKACISLYSMGVIDDESIVEKFLPEFPGAKAGRSCINIRRPELVTDDTLVRFARDAAEWVEGQR